MILSFVKPVTIFIWNHWSVSPTPKLYTYHGYTAVFKTFLAYITVKLEVRPFCQNKDWRRTSPGFRKCRSVFELFQKSMYRNIQDYLTILKRCVADVLKTFHSYVVLFKLSTIIPYIVVSAINYISSFFLSPSCNTFYTLQNPSLFQETVIVSSPKNIILHVSPKKSKNLTFSVFPGHSTRYFIQVQCLWRLSSKSLRALLFQGRKTQSCGKRGRLSSSIRLCIVYNSCTLSFITLGERREAILFSYSLYSTFYCIGQEV